MQLKFIRNRIFPILYNNTFPSNKGYVQFVLYCFLLVSYSNYIFLKKPYLYFYRKYNKMIYFTVKYKLFFYILHKQKKYVQCTEYQLLWYFNEKYMLFDTSLSVCIITSVCIYILKYRNVEKRKRILFSFSTYIYILQGLLFYFLYFKDL